MPVIDPTGVGSAAPAGSAGKPSGSAAPAGNGNAAADLQAQLEKAQKAIIEEKKKAEHWKGKHERDTSELSERLTRLEGVAQGAGLGATKQPIESFADLDEDGLEKVIERGMSDSNPGLVKAATKEIARRAAEAASNKAVTSSREDLQRWALRNQVNAKVANEFGAPALDENSDLRQRADYHIAQLAGGDKNALEKNPNLVYLGFVLAQRDLTSGDKAEYERLKQGEQDRLRAEEAESQRRVIVTKSRDEDTALIKGGNLKEVLRRRVSGMLGAKK